MNKYINIPKVSFLLLCTLAPTLVWAQAGLVPVDGGLSFLAGVAGISFLVKKVIDKKFKRK